MHLHDALSLLHSKVSQFFNFKLCLGDPLECAFVILSAELNSTCLTESLQENHKERPIINYMLYCISKAKCFPFFLLPLSALVKLAGHPAVRSDAPFNSPEGFGQDFGAPDTKAPAQLRGSGCQAQMRTGREQQHKGSWCKGF